MSVSYKGKVHIHPGYVSAPYNPFQIKNWQETLRELELRWAGWLEIGNTSREQGLVDVNRMMKEFYPGNYTVVEAYIPKRGVFGFRLVFEDPREETMWMLRWS